MTIKTRSEGFEFPESFGEQLKRLAFEMIEEDSDLKNIPDSKGMVLVRVDSEEHEKRKDKIEASMVPFQYDGINFVVCAI